MERFAYCTIGFAALAFAPWTGSAAEYTDWYEIRREVIEELAERDVIDWSRQLAGQIDKADLPGLITALEVFIRSGHQERVPAMVRRLCGIEVGENSNLVGTRLDRPALTDNCKYYVGETLIRFGLWDSTRIFFDAFPEYYHADLPKYREQWWKTGDRDELEAWLKGRCDVSREGSFGEGTPRIFREYYWVLWQHGKLQSHAAQLRQEIVAHPTDARLIRKYLTAVDVLASHAAPPQPAPNIAWLGEVARPKYAMDAYDLGRTFAGKRLHSQAIRLLDHSLSRPITNYDRQAVQQCCSMLIPEEEKEKLIRRWTKAELAASCKEAGQVERAQQLVEELLGPDAETSDLGLVRFAGQVQRASGYRVIEKRIKKAEDESKDSVQYWLSRASYYIGRKELDQADDAFKKALALPPDDYRRTAVGEYARFLIRTCKQYDRTKRVLREELQRIAPNYDVVSPLVYWLLELDSKYDVPISADDPLLWQFLADRETYDHQEERVLKVLMGKSHSAAATDSFCARAVKLAGPDAHPSRRYIVGGLLLRADRARQAAPLLQDAFQRWPHPATRFQPARPLLAACLETGDLESAEQTLRSVRTQLHISELKSWLADLAIAAAEKGDKDNALRLWRKRANVDMNDLGQLDDLVATGMRQRLQAYYADVKNRDPNNRAVEAALARLRP